MNRIDKMRHSFLEGIGVPEESKFEVDDFQLLAIESVINGNDTLVVAPTGSGKTYIALKAIEAYLHLKKKVVYTTPLKALSNTKYNELKSRFEPEFSVGLLTGDRKIDVTSDAVVATTEILRNELFEGSDKYSLIILDEVHFISDPQRGPVWEESIILSPKNSALLMLSASISNYQEISEWISDVRGRPCNVIKKTGRPVELRFGFLHPDFGVLPISLDGSRIISEVLDFYSPHRSSRSHERHQMSHQRKDRRFNSRGSTRQRSHR